MAKTQPSNKTQLIKDELAKDANASPTDVAKKLKSHGVTAQYVSTVKSKIKSSSAPKKSAANTAKKASDKVSLGDLIKAKNLADQLGGVEKAKELLNAIAKLS